MWIGWFHHVSILVQLRNTRPTCRHQSSAPQACCCWRAVWGGGVDQRSSALNRAVMSSGTLYCHSNTAPHCCMDAHTAAHWTHTHHTSPTATHHALSMGSAPGNERGNRRGRRQPHHTVTATPPVSASLCSVLCRDRLSGARNVHARVSPSFVPVGQRRLPWQVHAQLTRSPPSA